MSGKSRRQGRGLVEMPPRRLQVELQAKRSKTGEARAPARVAHAGRLSVLRGGAAARFVPDAADEVAGRMLFEHFGRVVAVEPGLGDRDVGKSGGTPQAVDEVHLADRVARIPLGLEIDRLNDVVAARIGQIVGRQIGTTDRRVVSVAERDQRAIAEPRIVVMDRVPEMDMRIDHGDIGRHAPAPPTRRRRTQRHGSAPAGRSLCLAANGRLRRIRPGYAGRLRIHQGRGSRLRVSRDAWPAQSRVRAGDGAIRAPQRQAMPGRIA